MTCRVIPLGGGGAAFVCSRGRAPRALCSACKEHEHELLCDYPLTGARAGQTCSAKLCRRCARRVEGRDLCPPHARRVALPEMPK